jgi:hypothetical protein
MPMTLIEAAKRASGDVKKAGVIEMFAMQSQFLSVLPFEDIPGGSLTYNLEGELPGVGFRGFNESYDESTGIINPETERLYIGGGDLDVDKALIKTRGYGIRATEEASKVKALSMHISDRLINGDSESNPREFDGLRKRIAGAALFSGTGTGSNGALSLEQLDAAIDFVDNPTALIMSKAMRRKLTKAARGNVGGDIAYSTDNWGRQVTMYNDLPIVIVDYNELGQRVVDFNEAGPGGGSTSTSVYVASLGADRVMGIQNGGIDVTDLGELQSKPVLRTRVEWLMGMAVMHGRAAARLWGITNVDVTE